MMLNNKTRRISGQKGVATVEAALTLVFFFMILMGVMEAGRFVNVYQTLTNAAREGARLGVAPDSGTVNRPNEDEIREEVQSFLAANAIRGASVTVESNFAPGTTANEFTRVTASLPYQVLTVSWFSATEITLTGRAVMRNETAN